MNHIADRTQGESAPQTPVRPARGIEPYVVVAAMLVYAWLGSLATGSGEFGVSIAITTVAYLTGIYLYYGIGWLALGQRNYLLWAGALAGFALGYALTGRDGLWTLLIGYSMVIFGGTIVGRLTRSGYHQHRIFLIGLLVVLVFAIAQSAPYWKLMMTAIGEVGDSVLDRFEENFITLGYGPDAVRQGLQETSNMFRVVTRLVPAMTVLGAVLPFCVGFVIFNMRLRRTDFAGRMLAPFLYWKMPFAAIPVLIVVFLARLFGNEIMVLAADNILFALSLFYSITGLALVEFYLRKFNFSTAPKVLFYIIFFLTQFIGFIVTAFLGLIDSFVDWRKVQQLSLGRE